MLQELDTKIVITHADEPTQTEAKTPLTPPERFEAIISIVEQLKPIARGKKLKLEAEKAPSWPPAERGIREKLGHYEQYQPLLMWVTVEHPENKQAKDAADISRRLIDQILETGAKPVAIPRYERYGDPKYAEDKSYDLDDEGFVLGLLISLDPDSLPPEAFIEDTPPEIVARA